MLKRNQSMGVLIWLFSFQKSCSLEIHVSETFVYFFVHIFWCICFRLLSCSKEKKNDFLFQKINVQVCKKATPFEGFEELKRKALGKAKDILAMDWNIHCVFNIRMNITGKRCETLNIDHFWFRKKSQQLNNTRGSFLHWDIRFYQRGRQSHSFFHFYLFICIFFL